MSYLVNITFLRGFFDNLKFTGIHQGWSLTVEECFYFSALVILTVKQRIPLLIQAAIIFGIGTLLVLIFKDTSFHGFFGNFRFMISYTFFGRCIEFFVGMGLALILLKKECITFKLPVFTTIGFTAAALSIFAISMLRSRDVLGIDHPVGTLINNAILPVFIAVLFYGLINEKTWLSRLLSTPVFDLLGKSSYIFYLIHVGFIAGLLDRHFNSHLYTFVVLVCISILLFKLIEEPLNNFIRKTAIPKTAYSSQRKLPEVEVM